jgi:branched-chain amino acid transport system ATP-binding protein
MSLLHLRNVDVRYGELHVLRDVSIAVEPGEIVCLLGGNACGKSTTLKTVLGLVAPTRGEVHFDGRPITTWSTSDRIRAGLAIVPENRRIFGPLSVRENLLLGAHVRQDPAETERDLARVFDRFPRLRERADQPGGTLSGGEQQMLAVGRALMARPRLLLLDEPSMGLAPRLVDQSFALLRELNQDGMSILVVEQNARRALSIADRGYVLQTGRVVLADRADRLLENEHLARAYLGRQPAPSAHVSMPG